VPPYTRLALVYDAVMAHVDYARWARYAHRCLQRHADPSSILELGAGTGALALELQPLGDYDYLATDGAAAMVDRAREKVAARDVPVCCAVMDFTDIDIGEAFDAVVLLYDGLNYVQEPPALQALFHGAYDALRPGGFFCSIRARRSTPSTTRSYFTTRGRQKASDTCGTAPTTPPRASTIPRST